MVIYASDLEGAKTKVIQAGGSPNDNELLSHCMFAS
jgi:hypothetical protein